MYEWAIEALASANGIERLAHWAGIRRAGWTVTLPSQRLESLGAGTLGAMGSLGSHGTSSATPG